MGEGAYSQAINFGTLSGSFKQSNKPDGEKVNSPVQVNKSQCRMSDGGARPQHLYFVTSKVGPNEATKAESKDLGPPPKPSNVLSKLTRQ